MLEGLQVIFREYSDIDKNDILAMQRFLDVSRFLLVFAFDFLLLVHVLHNALSCRHTFLIYYQAQHSPSLFIYRK